MNSKFVYAFNEISMEAIFYSNNNKNNFQENPNYYFVKKGFNYVLKKYNELNENDFINGKVYNSKITYSIKNDKYYRTIKLNEINYDNFHFSNYNNNYFQISNCDDNYKSLKYKDPWLRGNSYGRAIHRYNVAIDSEDSEESFFRDLKQDLKYLERFEYEIKQFLYKFLFIRKGDIEHNDGWINIKKGITLCSDEYSDDHYHCHFYGIGNKNTNLFELIGKRFPCSCYLKENGKIIKYCNKTFIFKKKN